MSEIRCEIGKIKNVRFGMGGYQESMLGFTFDLGGKSWGVGDFWGQWGVSRSERTQWTEEERLIGLGKDCMKVMDLMDKCNVRNLDSLIGKPVRVYFKNYNTLSHWEILEDAI